MVHGTNDFSFFFQKNAIVIYKQNNKKEKAKKIEMVRANLSKNYSTCGTRNVQNVGKNILGTQPLRGR